MSDWIVAAVAMLLLAATGPAVAGSFSLSPLGLSIASREVADSVTATNTGNEPLVVQVRTLAWTQREGKDQREETRDLVVNPPIFRLAPGESQLVRLAPRMGPPRDNEAAYRVVFTEVPPKDAPRSEPGFRIALAMDIPVYVEPVAPAAPVTIRWDAERTDTGLRLRAQNDGNMHYRIVETQFSAQAKILYKQGILVVLPKSTLVLDMPAPPREVTAINLTAEDGAGHPVSFDIPIPPAR